MFIDFCELYREEPIPAKGDLMVKYSVFLIIQRNCSIPTVRNHLSVIKRHQKLAYDVDVPSPSQYLPLLSTLKGGAKFIGRNVKPKFPVTPNYFLPKQFRFQLTAPIRLHTIFFSLASLELAMYCLIKAVILIRSRI